MHHGTCPLAPSSVHILYFSIVCSAGDASDLHKRLKSYSTRKNINTGALMLNVSASYRLAFFRTACQVELFGTKLPWWDQRAKGADVT